MAKKIKFIIRDFCEADFPEVNELWSQTGMGGSHRGDTLEVVEKTIANGGKFFVMVEAV